MNILVIGGTRFVGYLLTWRLLAAGHCVTLFNRGTTPDPFGGRVQRLQGDRTTRDFERLLAGREFDAVVDFAAYTAADVAEAVRLLRDRVGHYVFLSTGQVYLVKEQFTLPAREEDYPGAVRPAPEDPEELPGWQYGVDKRAAEDLLQEAWEGHRFPATRYRMPMVNGERDHFRRIEGYLWRLLDGGPLLLPNGGENLCRHVYGTDVAAFLPQVVGRAETFGQAYNLAQDEQVPLVKLLRMLAAEVGVEPRFVPVSEEQLSEAGLVTRDVSPFSGRWMSRLDPARARTELGFRHQPLEQYLGKIVASFLAHPPPDRPEGYAGRERELTLAGSL